ncbi:MAG: FAD:protein FMN transferase [Planctomycetota bacterium]
MGTILKLVVYAQDEHEAQSWIDICLAEIERLMPILNNYTSKSEISLLNARCGVSTIVSEDLYQVLEHSHRWYELSGGAFDITCGAVFQLWKQARKSLQVPSELQQREARESSGWQHVKLRKSKSADGQTDTYQVTVDQPGLVLDVSGVATGYIIDAAIDKMTRAGGKSFLIDIGGDIRLGDAPEGKSGWVVQIGGLGKASPPIMQLSLANCSLTTSGDRNQSTLIDGVSYSHLVDPRKGQPLLGHQSCTAISSKATDADAAATTLSVMGMRDSSTFFDRLGIDQAILLFSDPLIAEQKDSPVSFVRLAHE